MSNVRIARVLGFFWEILRFGFISLTLIYYINPRPDLTISFFVILAGSAQLIIPAGIILMLFHPERYRFLGKLLALGKAFSVVASAAIIVTQTRFAQIVIQTIIDASDTDKVHIPEGLPLFVLYAIALIGLIDLVMVLFLIQTGERSDG